MKKRVYQAYHFNCPAYSFNVQSEMKKCIKLLSYKVQIRGGDLKIEMLIKQKTCIGLGQPKFSNN